uniref:Uncharacterized protein n=1 Tax=Myoviridae sp. ct8ME27 TaxID=2826622 RepID=A0A8S5N6D6_9CAUD|nr:MAG TPA: hypothetical protein [Myoviridae sp. ct8ME27]
MIEFKAINSLQFATLSISDDERIIYVTDTEEVYIEKNGYRTQFRDIVYLSSSSKLPIAPLDKIYFTLDDRKMRYFYAGEWIILNTNNPTSYGNAITLEFGDRIGLDAATRIEYGDRI